MSINQRNDATQDNSQLVQANLSISSENQTSSAVFDLKQADPSQFKVRLEWDWTTVAAGSHVRVVVVGGDSPSFATGYYLLGATYLGAPDNIAADTGVTIAGYRGDGKYVIECSNVAGYNDGGAGDFRNIACRYIQVWFSSVGVDSAGFATIRIDHK